MTDYTTGCRGLTLKNDTKSLASGMIQGPSPWPTQIFMDTSRSLLTNEVRFIASFQTTSLANLRNVPINFCFEEKEKNYASGP